MKLITQLYRFSQAWLFFGTAIFIWQDFQLSFASTGAIIISQIWVGVALIIQEVYKQETPVLPKETTYGQQQTKDS